ncbi:MAG: glycerol-3-phosphate dehydrogenase [Magnetovibrio sp.]|nr:glycerol-3-phosphate dehydrogenase [Magnetovibrio sp.]
MSGERIYDLAIIGGGINGCGIARDAAGRGLNVALCEQGDLAQGTSSASTKLIHGGLRYLEHYEFGLVRKALSEREVLLRAAPHIISPMRFILPHHKGLRPAWLLRMGLFLYDHLGGRDILPGTRSVDLQTEALGVPLLDTFKKGFEYSDCWVDDARLVVLNAQDAKALGAQIMVRTKCISAVREVGLWRATMEDVATGRQYDILAKALVNAAGPWVDQVLGTTTKLERKPNVRLVRGSHIIVPRLYDHDRSYIFQNPDGRIFFAIPYENDFTLIGTTDEDHTGSLDRVSITDDEVLYLCNAAKHYFRTPPEPSDVVWSYAGVRPLFDDGASAAQEATRDYVLKLEANPGDAPLLNIFGGKITTYRKLAEATLTKLSGFFPHHALSAWTKNAPLPGGELPINGLDDFGLKVEQRYPFINQAWAKRLVRTYGSAVFGVLGNAKRIEDLGERFGADLTEREVGYLIENEWAQTSEDILWRRTKLGLHTNQEEQERLKKWVRDYRANKQTAAE